jgi:sigma-B regulation protein RsbU (phosphoserine phosphatase)
MMSLRKRIQIVLSFLVCIPLLLLLYESYRASRHTLLESLKQEALQVARLEAAEMDLIFDPPRRIIDGIVRTLESEQDLRADSIRDLLRRTLNQSPEIYGVAVAFDPELTPLKSFAPYFYRRDGVETERSLAEHSNDYINREWYRLPMESLRGRWIKPYFDEGGGETLMVTFASPLLREGRVVGVAEVDLDLEGLVARLKGIKPGGDGIVCLVSQEGQILAHPALRVMAEVEEGHNLAHLKDLVKRSGEDTVEMIDPVSHIRSWIVETPIEALSEARGGHNWSLVVSWPLSTRLAPLTELGRKMLALYLFLGGASLFFLNRSFDQIITLPLRRLAERAGRYAEGDFSRPAPGGYDALELRELSRALDRLGETLAKSSPPDPAQKGGVP